MTGFEDFIFSTLGSQKTDKVTQVTPRQVKRRKVQVDAHALGIMVDRGATASIRILDGYYGA